jgi:hypothetical protein
MQDKLTPEQQRKAWDASVGQVKNQEDMALRQWCVLRAIDTLKEIDGDVEVIAMIIYRFLTIPVFEMKMPDEKSSGG